MKQNKVTRRMLIEAYKAFDCIEWKEHIRDLLTEYLLIDVGECIPLNDKYMKLLEGATYAQKEYAVKAGIEFKKDSNAFVKDCCSHSTIREIETLSEKLFGDRKMFQLGAKSIIQRKEELYGRCFYVSPDIKVNLMKGISDSTIIEFVLN